VLPWTELEGLHRETSLIQVCASVCVRWAHASGCRQHVRVGASVVSARHTHAHMHARTRTHTRARALVVPAQPPANAPHRAQPQDKLAALNAAGYLTINSQPPLNGVPSTDPEFGWGGPGG
jgi:hypothetical protein